MIADELGHVLHRDILISSVAATIAAAITMLASMARWTAIFGGFGNRDDDNRGGALGYIFMLFLAPIAALLIQMAISRTREYSAILQLRPAAARLTTSSGSEVLETYSKPITVDASRPGRHVHLQGVDRPDVVD